MQLDGNETIQAYIRILSRNTLWCGIKLCGKDTRVSIIIITSRDAKLQKVCCPLNVLNDEVLIVVGRFV